MPGRRRPPTYRPPRRTLVTVGGTLPLWTPPDEDQSPESCTLCGGKDGLISRGDQSVCLGCLQCGFDSRLDAELARERAERERAELLRNRTRQAELIRRRLRRAAKKARGRESI